MSVKLSNFLIYETNKKMSNSLIYSVAPHCKGVWSICHSSHLDAMVCKLFTKKNILKLVLFVYEDIPIEAIESLIQVWKFSVKTVREFPVKPYLQFV